MTGKLPGKGEAKRLSLNPVVLSLVLLISRDQLLIIHLSQIRELTLFNMPVYSAKVLDILRCSQRDDMFVQYLSEEIFSILNVLNIKQFIYLRKLVPTVASGWYYFLTSLDNLQTLGEEYTGSLRLNRDGKLPNKSLHFVWFILYIGGESIYERLFSCLRTKLANSTTLANDTKDHLLKVVSFMLDYKTFFLKLHHSWFYINGSYYNFSNRITGIRYVLLRDWLQSDSFTKNFKCLGIISLVYVIHLIYQQMQSSSKTGANTYIGNVNNKRLCTLCADYRKDVCTTSCGHMFCWNCIYESLNYQQNCPICRDVIHASRIIYLQNYS